MTTYERYEALLVTNNMTSYEVAKRTGIAQSTLSEWKTGRSEPKVDKMIQIAEVFNVPLDYFYRKEDPVIG